MKRSAEVGQGEEMRLVSKPRDENDVTIPVVGESSTDENIQPNPNPQQPQIPPQTEPGSSEPQTCEMSSEELLIDFSEDVALNLSRLPPDGHEFPPVFDDQLEFNDVHSASNHCGDKEKSQIKIDSQLTDTTLGKDEQMPMTSSENLMDSFDISNDAPAVTASEVLIELMSFDEEKKLRNSQDPFQEVTTPTTTFPPPPPVQEPPFKPEVESAKIIDENESENCVPVLRRPFKLLLRNVDEKNSMSLQEKIALFSQDTSRKQNGVNEKNCLGKITNKMNNEVEKGNEDDNDLVVLRRRHSELNSKSTEKETVVYRTEWNCSLPEKNSFDGGDGRRNTISTMPRTSYRDKVKNSTNSSNLSNSSNFSSSSLYSLLESRRQQVSKLKGLVIPEKNKTNEEVNNNNNNNNNNNSNNYYPKNKAKNSLPLITSGTESLRKSKMSNLNLNLNINKFGSLPRSFDYINRYQEEGMKPEDEIEESPLLSAPPWKDVGADFPKYSPAFKRKSLSVVQGVITSETNHASRPRSFTASPMTSFEEARKTTSAINQDGNVETEDKDSIVSSSGSNFSASLSPPMSPNGNFCSSQSQEGSSINGEDVVEEFVVVRIEETTSPNDVEATTQKNKEKLEKNNRTNSTDTLNRRNILEQAKHSRGSTSNMENESDTQTGSQVTETKITEVTGKYYHRKSSSDVGNVTKSDERKFDFNEKNGKKVKSFRDIAQQWEKRSNDSVKLVPAPQTRRKSLPATAAPIIQETDKSIGQHFRDNRSYSVSTVTELKQTELSNNRKNPETHKNFPRRNGFLSSPDKKDSPTNGIQSKRPVLHSSNSIGDLLKVFEQQQPPSVNGVLNKSKEKSKRDSTLRAYHAHMSSQDSTASESEFLGPTHYGSVNSLTSVAHDQYGSITSLASSTSLISPQELQQLLDDANQSLEESGTPLHEIIVVVLHREIAGGSIGITLAGGADYEAKEITVHKIISGSLADRDGRIQKGDRVLSINGKNVKGITHKEALNILKAPRPECVLVLSRNTCDLSEEPNGKSMGSLTQDITQPVKLQKKTASRSIFTVDLTKDSAGLGFSLEGGKDSLRETNLW